jgi:branched-chain amino acid transport system substrate-binding protein
MHKRKQFGLAAAALSVAMLAAACSSNGGGAGGGATATSGPIRIAYLSILSGPNFVKGGDNAFKMAVEEINAAGGINGRQLEYKEFDTDITPQGAVNATNLAIQYDPTLIVGYGVSAGLKASISAINNAGLPVMHGTLASLTSPSSLGSQLTFRVGSPTTAQYAKAADDYLFQDQGVKSLMMINTQDSAPTEGAKYILDDAAARGVKTEHRAVSPTVTDMTEPILAAKSMNADAIWNWGYATTDALTVKTAAANGYTGKIMTFSAGTAARVGLIPASLLTDNITAVNACAPYVLDTDAAKKFVDAYKAKYGTALNDSVAAWQYDAVYLFKQAVEKAGSTDPKQVAQQLTTADYNGVCGELKTDSNHNLIHQVPIIKYTGGAPTLVKLQTNLDSPF